MVNNLPRIHFGGELRFGNENVPITYYFTNGCIVS